MPRTKAQFLEMQDKARERILEKRRRVWERYHEGLSDWAEEHHIRLPVVPKGCLQAYHM